MIGCCCSVAVAANCNAHPEVAVIECWLGSADQLSCEVQTAGTKCDGAWPRVLALVALWC